MPWDVGLKFLEYSGITVGFLILLFLGVQNLAMSVVFVLGYMGIIFEEFLAFNKSGVGLLMAVTLWVIRSIGVLSPPLKCHRSVRNRFLKFPVTGVLDDTEKNKDTHSTMK